MVVQIPDNVNAFIAECGKTVGEKSAGDFLCGLDALFTLHEITSPIEQIFAAALDMTINITGEQDNVAICPQHVFGRYRVDFYLSREGKAVVVELDGHEFHERDEPQRRYEKARDRFFMKKGMNVFHYTGAEVVQKPFMAVCECLEEIGVPYVREELEAWGKL